MGVTECMDATGEGEVETKEVNGEIETDVLTQTGRKRRGFA